MENHSIGKTIVALRKEKGWTQIDLAEKLQVSDKAVSKWEKDNGMPSVEFFPVLAQLFGVSIDYIMTGKTAEKEIITMSKLELCAKKDDPELLGNFGAHSKDENGKSLMFYVKKYKANKVLVKLIDRCKHQTHYMALFPKNEFDFPELLMLIKVDREIIVLNNIASRTEIRAISNFSSESLWISSKTTGTLSNGYKNIFTYLVNNYEKLSQNQQEYYFGKDVILKPKTAWTSAYPYFLDIAYKTNNSKLFELFLERIVKTNEEYEEWNNNLRKEMGSYYESHFRSQVENHLRLYVLPSTVKCAFNQDVQLGECLNKLCKTPLTAYEISCIEIDKDKKLTKQEKQVAKTIHDGVVYIDELLELNDIKIITTVLNSTPIHTAELLFALLENKDWRKLFQWAVDERNSALYTAVLEGDIKNIEKEIIKYTKIETADFKANRKYIKVIERKEFYGKIREDVIQLDWKNSKEELLDFFKTCKAQILDNITLSFDKEATLAELSKEFFEKELEKGNAEIVIIKLCVRLESVLKCNYHYEGDFADMITRYCNEKLHWEEDDGWGYMVGCSDDKAINLLHKLRKQRNSIVHSEKDNETMTVAEIKECIDLICCIK